MKVVAYSIKPFEKEFLAKANQKKHDITLISNRLNIETAVYAEGKDAIIVFTSDDVSAPVIDKLAKLGIKYIITRSVETGHIDKETAAKYAIKLSNMIITPCLEYYDSGELQEIANQTIHNLDMWQQNKCVGKACVCAKDCRAFQRK
jgi:hypothetical protein